MTDWQPIETAPKDGTVVDLWVVDQDDPKGRRIPNAYWVKDRGEGINEYDAAGNYKGQKWRKRDGWFAPGFDYDGEDGFCDFPRHFNDHPRQMREVFTEATHWMLPPDPPA